MTICQKIGLAVSAWAVAGTLAVLTTIDNTNRHFVAPWLLMSLSVAITSSVSLMIWRAQADVTADIRAARSNEEAPALRVV